MKEIVLSGCFVVNPEKEVYLLFRKKYQHYETPGGKAEPGENLRETALRELFEEVSGIREDDIIEVKYFGSVHFTIPDGRKAVAHKFIIRLNKNLNLKPNEEIFDEKLSKFIPIRKLKDIQEKLSPDLKTLLSDDHQIRNLEYFCR